MCPASWKATDSSKLLYGLANRGIGFIDAAVARIVVAIHASFSSAPVAQPSTGPNSGGTVTVVTAPNFESGAAIQFGTQTATVQSTGATQIQAASPASAASGAVNVSAFFSGWLGNVRAGRLFLRPANPESFARHWQQKRQRQNSKSTATDLALTPASSP